MGTRTESSIHSAYCDLVQNAGHFVYIENQFFVSGMDGDEAVGNRVAEAIYRRIVGAHTKKETFLVMIVLPLLPAFDGTIAPNKGTSLTGVMSWQYRTLRTLRSRLEEMSIDPDEYLNVYGLRTFGYLDDGKNCVTEQIYVHSKVMLVDDQVSIIGSANVNDRSLLGMRDSEIDVLLKDTIATDSVLGGVPWQSGALTSQLRRALFAQHLGWSQEDLDGKYADPLAEETLREVRRVAKQNAEIYEAVFGSLPSNSIRSWADLSERRAQGLPRGSLGTTDMTRTPSTEALKLLKEVQGHLVEFPLHFLEEEDLAPSLFAGVHGLTPDVFT